MTFLRRVLFIDATTCLAMGLALLLLAQPAAPLLGLPAMLLEMAGAALLPIAAFIGWSAVSGRLPWLIVAGNVAWVLASAALLLGGWVSPTALGYGFVIVQATVVAALAAMEYAGVRSA